MIATSIRRSFSPFQLITLISPGLSLSPEPPICSIVNSKSAFLNSYAMMLVSALCRYIREPNAEKVTETSYLPPRKYLHFSFLGHTCAYNLLLAATVHCFGFILYLYHIKGFVLTHAHPGPPLDSTQSFSSLDIRSRTLLLSAFSHAWVRLRLLLCTSLFPSRISSINGRMSGSAPSFIVSLSFVASAAFW